MIEEASPQRVGFFSFGVINRVEEKIFPFSICVKG